MDQQTQAPQPSSQAPRPSAPSWVPKILVLLVVVVVGGIVAAMQGKKASDMSTATDTKSPVPTVSATDVQAKPSTAYKDGIYSTEGNYVSPAGPESIDVTLTVKDGVITDAGVTNNAQNPTSLRFQEVFAGAYKPFVVGKKLSELSLGAVSGASLTSKGFNDALKEIRTQASS